ncbi:MAG: LLM class flavin-dependent oxidoreductase, partial [Erysipelothrix sp.]|nr:LLM class flavin-dependent oxidoreductase [Erysipelothrix sp.]
MDKILFGLDTFGEVALNNETLEPVSYEESLRLIIEEGILADKLG